jgi:hypothetical protein
MSRFRHPSLAGKVSQSVQAEKRISLFHSKEVHGVKMNQFGVVLREDSSIACVELRDYIWREARAAGWTFQKSDDKDVGMVWVAPEVEGSGQE